MNAFATLLQSVTSSSSYDKMLKFVRPLKDYFGINHFWYYRITYSGHYSYLGTHAAWDEYCFTENLFSQCPYLRHPDTFSDSIVMMKQVKNDSYLDLLKQAAQQFDINFNVHLLKKVPEGVEGYGFGTQSSQNVNDELILNELPLISQFIKKFRQENSHMYHLVHANQIDIASHLGNNFQEKSIQTSLLKNREGLLKEFGFNEVLKLNDRELEIFKVVAHGHTAKHIASQVLLAPRTVETYLDIIKQKLACKSKSELIQFAKDFVEVERSYITF